MDVICTHCGAAHWKDERLSKSTLAAPKFGVCCMDGKVQLPALQDPPPQLRELLTSPDQSCVKFRQNLWKYNRAFAFTSLGVSEDHSVNHGRGPPVFRIFGELHHLSGALETTSGRHPRYSQLYIHEPRAALDFRMKVNTDLDRATMSNLQSMLRTSNPYVGLYQHAYQILKNYDPSSDVQIRLRLLPGHDHRRYNLPSADEVAVILPDNQAGSEPRDIVLRRTNNSLQRISELHPSYTPLQYPLLFPFGEPGWYPEMMLDSPNSSEHQPTQENQEPDAEEDEDTVDMGDIEDEGIGRSLNKPTRETQGAVTEEDGDVEGINEDEAEEEGGGDLNPRSRRLTLTRYAAYHLHYRPGLFNTLLRGGRLFTHYVVNMFAAIDQMRLRFIEKNQDKFRAARFNNLEDAIVEDPDNVNLNDLGQRVFLPSSYTGGPRYMHQCYQDSMALARYYRKVDLFLTMTTNPEWPEIQNELLPGQTPYDRPDLVARVFKLKKDALIKHITKHGIFGKAIAHVYTIEFQKRGLPHMHLLIFLEDQYKMLTTDDIDICIWARWPDPGEHPLLFEAVRKCMVHGPCGTEFPNAPCMVNGKCSKGYPKAFSSSTTMDGSGYPEYYRPDNGRTYEVNGRLVDNRWIVPYSPFLLSRFFCHLNMEFAVSIASFKYISKYIQKGPDRGLLEIDMKNEVKRWRDGRYISAPDATWRIFQFWTHQQKPGVVRLQVHLPNEHTVTFNPFATLDTILQKANQDTTLTAYFKTNADNGLLGEEARKHTYQEFPQFFVYQASKRRWKLRERGFALGRMYFIKPTAGELFYLRTLLTVVKGTRTHFLIRNLLTKVYRCHFIRRSQKSTWTE